MIRSNHIETLRAGLLGLTGLACLSFAILALVQQRPDPFFWWVPGGLGLASALALFAVSWLAGDRQADMAYDELNAANQRRAGAMAYWLSLGLFVPCALGMAYGIMPHGALMAAFGAAMGANYLLAYVWLDLRGRG